MRPGGGPLWYLARSLAALEGGTPSPSRVDELRLSFDRSHANLAGIVTQLAGMERARLCLLIDQFEELFRYARETSREEARLFVNLITGALKEDSGSPVRVILTMRSEFLGECARLPELAGVVNSAQYLLPRMETASLHRAIRRPAELYGGHVTIDLADRLIADVQGSQDELPLIQHGLMRLWDLARATVGDTHSPRRLDLPLYEAHGPLARMLDRHAEEVAAAAASDERGRRVVEEMFRAMSDINSDAQAIRRPQSLKNLIAVTGAEPGLLVSILESIPVRQRILHYAIRPGAPRQRDNDRHQPRGADPLLEQARGRTGWLAAQRVSPRLDLAIPAVSGRALRANQRNVLGPATTEDREHWLKDRTPAWSERYGGGWNRVERLISASRKEADRQRRRDQVMIWALGIFAGVSLTAFLVAGHQWLEAVKQAEISRRHERQIAHQLDRATIALAESRLNDFDLTPDRSLTARQRNALWKLAMADEAVQLSFIAALSASPEDMGRVAAGFRAVSRSLGFQSPSPDQAEKFFLAALAALEWPAREPKTARSVAIAFESVAPKLTKAQAQRALAQVLNQFDRTTDPDVLRALAQAIEALPVKLTEAQAQQALAPVLHQIGQSTNSDALHVLAQAFQTLAGKLSGAQAQQALDLVIKRFGQTTNSDVLRALAQAIPALAVKVTEPPAQQALAAVIKQIDQTTDPYLVRALAQAIQALADKLTGAQAQQALAQMLKQFDRTTDPDVFQALAQAVEALPVQPTEAQVQQALDAITKQIEPLNRDQTLQMMMMMMMMAESLKNIARPHDSKVSFLPAWAWRIQTLGSKLSETQAQQALTQLLKQFDRTTDPSVLRALVYSIQTLPAKLTEAQARQALAPLLKQFGQTTNNSEVLSMLAQAIQVLASKLGEAQSQQALAPLLKQFGQTTNSEVLRALAQAIQALASKLSEAQSQQALAPLLKQFGETTNSDVLRALAQAIPALAVKVTEFTSAASARRGNQADRPDHRSLLGQGAGPGNPGAGVEAK